MCKTYLLHFFNSINLGFDGYPDLDEIYVSGDENVAKLISSIFLVK